MDAIVGGLVSGGLYALIAQSFVLTFLTTRTLNFAVGEFMAVAAFLGLAVSGWEWLPAARSSDPSSVPSSSWSCSRPKR